MHYTGEVYRHPMEWDTPLLEVTIGCSHNTCTFCTMYRQTAFGVSPIEHIEEDLRELKSFGRPVPRIYLLNADPFVLSARKLATIGEMIRIHFPEIKTITGYASLQNIKHKSLDDLVMLRKIGFNDLHIGLETAYDPALKTMNKGYSAEEAYEQLHRIKEAGFRYDALLMLGAGGSGNGEANAEETAKLLNETRPYMVSVMPTSVFPGSDLAEIAERGDFKPPTELEILEEEKLLISLLDLDDCYFFGSHRNNLVQVSGQLKEKEELIGQIDSMIAGIDSRVLNNVKLRASL